MLQARINILSTSHIQGKERFGMSYDVLALVGMACEWIKHIFQRVYLRDYGLTV